MEHERETGNPPMSGERETAADRWHHESRTHRLVPHRCACGGECACERCGDRPPRLIEVSTILASPSLWAASHESRDPAWNAETLPDGTIFAQQIRG